VTANGENVSGGLGIQRSGQDDLYSAGVDIITTGNHIWNKKEAISLLKEENSRLLRPANYPERTAGKGSLLIEKYDIKIGVINILGRVFMDPIESPFFAVDREIDNLKKNEAKIIIVDFHAEATAEKEAMAFYLKDRVSLLAGTHTHIQTSDEKIFPEGMGYITDLGRCGSFFSVLGVEYESSLKGFLTMVPQHFTPDTGKCAMEGVIAEISVETGKTLKIERIRIF